MPPRGSRCCRSTQKLQQKAGLCPGGDKPSPKDKGSRAEATCPGSLQGGQRWDKGISGHPHSPIWGRGCRERSTSVLGQGTKGHLSGGRAPGVKATPKIPQLFLTHLAGRDMLPPRAGTEATSRPPRHPAHPNCPFSTGKNLPATPRYREGEEGGSCPSSALNFPQVLLLRCSWGQSPGRC